MMRKAEQVICFLWIVLALGVCLVSLGLKLGSFSDPGPGFLPFGTGALLGILAIGHLAHVTLLPQKKEDLEFPWVNVHWENVAYVVIALLSYTFLLPILGYLIDTLLLMLFLFALLERKKWWASLIGSLLVIGITYLVFEVWLMVQFPKGFLGIG